QDLFYPPNVGGWNEGRAWLNSGAIVARANFATALVSGQLTLQHSDLGLAALVDKHTDKSDTPHAIQWLAELLFGGLPPETIAKIAESAQEKSDLPPLESAALILLTRPEAHLT